MVPNKLENLYFNLCASKMLCCTILLVIVVIGTSNGDIQSEQSAPPARIQQCREGCLQKFATEDFACLQGPECSMCWDQCAEPPSKINKAITNTWVIRIVGMFRQGSLVATDIKWPIIDPPSQCLVTWEVSGGGLMGNLLTDSNTVQLSLWPETRYRVQVTCKNKKTEVIGRSLPLTIDTRDSIVMHDPSSSESNIVETVQPSSTATPYYTTTSSTTSLPSASTPKTTVVVVRQQTKILSKFDLYKLNQKANNNFNNEINSLKLHLTSSDSSSSSAYDYLSVNQHQNEIVLGIITAILVFGIFILLFIINLRRKLPNEKIALLPSHHHHQQQQQEQHDSDWNSRCDDPSQTILHSVQTVHV